MFFVVARRTCTTTTHRVQTPIGDIHGPNLMNSYGFGVAFFSHTGTSRSSYKALSRVVRWAMSAQVGIPYGRHVKVDCEVNVASWL